MNINKLCFACGKWNTQIQNKSLNPNVVLELGHKCGCGWCAGTSLNYMCMECLDDVIDRFEIINACFFFKLL